MGDDGALPWPPLGELTALLQTPWLVGERRRGTEREEEGEERGGLGEGMRRGGEFWESAPYFLLNDNSRGTDINRLLVFAHFIQLPCSIQKVKLHERSHVYTRSVMI